MLVINTTNISGGIAACIDLLYEGVGSMIPLLLLSSEPAKLCETPTIHSYKIYKILVINIRKYFVTFSVDKSFKKNLFTEGVENNM